MEDPLIEDNLYCHDGICNYTYIKVCHTLALKDREYCLHQPPLEMALKVVGMYTFSTFR